MLLNREKRQFVALCKHVGEKWDTISGFLFTMSRLNARFVGTQPSYLRRNTGLFSLHAGIFLFQVLSNIPPCLICGSQE